MIRELMATTPRTRGKRELMMAAGDFRQNQRGWGHALQLARSSLRLGSAASVALTLLFAGRVALAAEPSLDYVRSSLGVLVQGDLPNFWKVRRAELRENLTATWGYLEIQNISTTAVHDAVFYGEYFDAAGRLCLSLLFSLDKNVVGKRGPIAPGEARELYSLATGLAPASEPKQVELYLVQQRPAGPSGEPTESGTSVRAPVTVEGSFPAGREKLWLGPELELAAGPLLDLVLARVHVDPAGHVGHVDVLHTISAEVESWFLDFVRLRVFYPARTGGVPEPGEALLLVRAVVSTEALRASPPLARTSPWVADYVGNLMEGEIPPVTELIFVRPPTRVKLGGSMEWTELAPAPPGLFQPLSVDSEWCSGVFTWVIDPVAPHHLRPELPVADRR